MKLKIDKAIADARFKAWGKLGEELLNALGRQNVDHAIGVRSVIGYARDRLGYGNDAEIDAAFKELLFAHYRFVNRVNIALHPVQMSDFTEDEPAPASPSPSDHDDATDPK